MKKFLVEVSHTEYTIIEVEAKDECEAEKIAVEELDHASWGNDETEIINVEEINASKINNL